MPRVADEWLRRVLRNLYQRRTVTRADILESTRLNPASVSHALQLLMERGLVLRVGQIESNGGRRRELLKLNADAGYFVAVDLEGTSIRFALTNFVGDIRCRWEADIDFGETLDIQRIIGGIDRVLRNLSSHERSQALAVGISHPGISEHGRVTAFNLGWSGFPLIDELKKRVSLPIFVEKYHRTCILAERSVGAAQGKKNCIYVILGIGVGIGGLVQGRLLEGHHGMAGEVGHITIDPQAKDRCNCGRFGCLEAIASSPNIVRQYLERNKRTRQARAMRVTEVFEAARQGDRTAVEVLDRAAKCLGLAIAHTVNLLNPELIIFGGDVDEAQDVLLGKVKDEILRHTLPKLTEGLEITVSALGLDIGLKGAASLAFHNSLAEPRLLKRMCEPCHFSAPAPNAPVVSPPAPRRRSRLKSGLPILS